jgi:hypothetical protein
VQLDEEVKALTVGVTEGLIVASKRASSPRNEKVSGGIVGWGGAEGWCWFKYARSDKQCVRACVRACCADRLLVTLTVAVRACVHVYVRAEHLITPTVQPDGGFGRTVYRTATAAVCSGGVH